MLSTSPQSKERAGVCPSFTMCLLPAATAPCFSLLLVSCTAWRNGCCVGLLCLPKCSKGDRNGSVGFFCSWSFYTAGFGSQESKFWLGNENLHQLTLQGKFPAGPQETWRGDAFRWRSESPPWNLRIPPSLPPPSPQEPGSCGGGGELKDFIGNGTFAHCETDLPPLWGARSLPAVLGKFSEGMPPPRGVGGA